MLYSKYILIYYIQLPHISHWLYVLLILKSWFQTRVAGKPFSLRFSNTLLSTVWHTAIILLRTFILSVWNRLPTHCRCRRFLWRLILLSGTHTHTLDMGALEKGSTRRTYLYLKTPNTHNRQTDMTPAGFEPVFPSSEWPQTHASDRAASGTCLMFLSCHLSSLFSRNYRVLFNPRSCQPYYIHQARRTYCRATYWNERDVRDRWPRRWTLLSFGMSHRVLW
jgi:hypothetical protein